MFATAAAVAARFVIGICSSVCNLFDGGTLLLLLYNRENSAAALLLAPVAAVPAIAADNAADNSIGDKLGDGAANNGIGIGGKAVVATTGGRGGGNWPIPASKWLIISTADGVAGGICIIFAVE